VAGLAGFSEPGQKVRGGVERGGVWRGRDYVALHMK